MRRTGPTGTINLPMTRRRDLTTLGYRRIVTLLVYLVIVPGVMLQSNFSGLKRMANLCGTAIPARIAALYEGLENDAETRDLVTAHVAADLCSRLAEQGVDHFHFYTMNRAGLSLSTCRLLGIKPEAQSV